MDLFYQTFGFVAAIVAGVVLLTLFFVAVGYFKRVARGHEVVTLKGLVRSEKLVNVHLRDGKPVLGVRFVGVTDRNSGKGGFPLALPSMIVLESATGSRVMVRADAVRMIEEVEGTP